MMLTVAVSSSSGDSAHLSRLRRRLAAQDADASIECLVDWPRDGHSLAQVRNGLYARARGRWVLFLDEDCEPPDDGYLTRLIKNLVSAPEAALGGGYLDVAEAGPWSRAYNALVNYWLTMHARRGRALPVAGCFALPKLETGGEFPFALAHPFGGEEIALARALAARGLGFRFDPALSVRHHGGKTARGFLRRAWQHGRAPHRRVGSGEALAHLWSWARRECGYRVGARMALYLGVVWLARRL